MFRRVISALALFIVALYSDDGNADLYYYHPSTTLHLGSNFDPLDMTKVYPPCILNGDEEPVDGVNSTPVSSNLHFSIRQIHSKRDLYTLVKMSASVSGQYEMFSADAAVGSESENQSTTEALSWVLSINSDFGRYRAKNPQLTKEADALAKKNLIGFRERCGSEVVLQVTRGVSLAVVFSADASSQSRRDALNSSLNADFGGELWGVSASAEFSNETKEAIKHGEISIDVIGSGGGGAPGLAGLISDLKDLKSIDAIKNRLSSYAGTLSSDKTAIIEYQTGPISSLVPELKTPDFALYNWVIGEMYFALEQNTHWLQRLQNFIADSADFDASQPDVKQAKENYLKLRQRVFAIAKSGRACRDKLEVITNAALRPKGNHRPHETDPHSIIENANTFSESLLSVSKMGAGQATSFFNKSKELQKGLSSLVPESSRYDCFFDPDWLDVSAFSTVPEFPFDPPVIWTDPLNAAPADFLYTQVSGKAIQSARLVDLDTEHDLLVIQPNGTKFEGMFDLSSSPATHRVDLVITTKTGHIYRIAALR